MTPLTHARDLLTREPWGGRCIVALYLSLLSGLVVALQYDPSAPYHSTVGMDTLAPVGAYFRSLHFYSSQLFLVLSVLHFLAMTLDRRRPVPLDQWLKLVLGLAVVVLLLFTGYVLRGDLTGTSAGLVAENILRSIPVAGGWLNDGLLAISEEGMKRVYPNHLVGLALLWLALSWQHVRRYAIGVGQHGGLAALTLAFPVFVAAPMEPARLGTFHLSGPWFFLGVQELLTIWPPLWAGVVFPVSFLTALVCLNTDGAIRRLASGYALFWLVLYTALSLPVALGR